MMPQHMTPQSAFTTVKNWHLTKDTFHFWGLQEKYDRWFRSSNNSVLYNK